MRTHIVCDVEYDAEPQLLIVATQSWRLQDEWSSWYPDIRAGILLYLRGSDLGGVDHAGTHHTQQHRDEEQDEEDSEADHEVMLLKRK